MTYTSPKPGGWATNELLTSAQMNALDAAIADAFDDDAALLAAAATNNDRDLAMRLLRLRALDIGGTTTDTSAALGVASASTGQAGILAVKGTTNGVQRFNDTPLANTSGAMASITSQLRKLVFNGTSQHLAIGAGGNENAVSSDDGVNWAAGGATGLLTPPTDCVWDGSQYVLASDAGGSAHSTNGGAWTNATPGSDIVDICVGGGSGGLAKLTGGNVIAAGTDGSAHPFFAKTTNHGLTWASSGGTIPSPASYGNAGYLAGTSGGAEIYWLGKPTASSTKLELFVSTNGSVWTKRSEIIGLSITGSPQPKLYCCQDTAILVAIVAEVAGTTFAVAASNDHGVTWLATQRINVTAAHAIGMAAGRLFATIGGKLFASDGFTA